MISSTPFRYQQRSTEVNAIYQAEPELIAYCDGGCDGSGKSAIGRYGYVVYCGKDKIAEGSGKLTEGSLPTPLTSNVAEYVSVFHALEWLHASGYDGKTIRVRNDSRLVMQQLGMLCPTRSRHLLLWHRRVRELARHFEVEWEWIPRSWNIEADARTRSV